MRKREAWAWGGAAAFPILLYVVLLNVADEPAVVRLLLPALVFGLLGPLLRVRPLPAVLLLQTGAFGVVVTLPEPATGYLMYLLADVVIGYLAAARPWRLAAAVTLLGQVAAAPFHTSYDGSLVAAVVFIVLALGLAVTIGYALRERRRHIAAVRDRAATDERLRIARELHDLVAHSIGAIAIQAGVGRRVIDTQPDEARRALATIEETSRETLAEFRRTLGALRSPAPAGLNDVDRLIAAQPGLTVDVGWSGDRRPLPPETDLAAYRVVQESLTNVVRHAHVGTCRVRIDYGPSDVAIEVTDDGRGGPVRGTGHGLIGMRERVRALGGSFEAGPRAAGGFRVAVRLPA